MTLSLFPLLYLTLELPKQIINDAIGSGSTTIEAYGYEFDQITYLMMLCGAFLLAVLAHGIMKMRINTMKGVLAERLLRRFRYTLIARILRFPQPYFERTSQGELVSMVTAESEPMGGLMGDAVAQPVLQAGQMLTILGFLFFQSVAFGLAAIALIPLQAWLIPKLQRQINQLNKKRVVQVRALAAEIGEGAAGAGTLRVNGGWRYRMAMIGDRLGQLFAIRFQIYQKVLYEVPQQLHHATDPVLFLFHWRLSGDPGRCDHRRPGGRTGRLQGPVEPVERAAGLLQSDRRHVAALGHDHRTVRPRWHDRRRPVLRPRPRRAAPDRGHRAGSGHRA
ncbi:ABC transporter transmembrane domain-containing protein [Tateyamaria sp. SN3-11]|uniref:ABC transporter transmembrane domain-containing protein n=1 Tax=Tateyamaria sp. SN3-11 TaxID=3092147 RepID=UPI0039EC860C